MAGARQRQPLDMLVAADHAIDPRWKSFQSGGYELSLDEPFMPLKELYHDLKAKTVKLTTEQQMRDALGICLKYRHVAVAARVLECLDNPSLEELAQLADSVKRASQVIPVGVEPEQHEKWRTILSGKWAGISLGENGWEDLSRERVKNVLLLHEILNGRGLAIIRDADEVVARLLIEKHYGTLSECDLRDQLDAGAVAGGAGMAP